MDHEPRALLSASGQPQSMPTVLQALTELTKRNAFHEKVMIGMMGILFAIGICFLLVGYYGRDLERVIGLIGGSLFEMMIILPYNRIQDLRKQNIVVGILAAVIDRFQDKVAAETLNGVVKDLLSYALRH